MIRYIIEVFVWTLFLYIFLEFIRIVIEYYIPKNLLKSMYNECLKGIENLELCGWGFYDSPTDF